MSQIKAVMDDHEGRFDKQELLAHIFNNSLGRPILFPTDVRAVGVALDNACTRQKKETKAAKAAGDAAIRRVRAGATKDPSLLPQVTVAQAARNAAVAAVLKMTYDFQLPTSTGSRWLTTRRRQVCMLPNAFSTRKRLP
jgi:hypothetical protein